MENNLRDKKKIIESDNVYELHCKFDFLTRVHLGFFFFPIECYFLPNLFFVFLQDYPYGFCRPTQVNSICFYLNIR